MRSDQDHSTCFPPRLLLPYISHHIHNDSLTREIKVLEYSECGLDTTLTRCSGHLFWTQTLFPEWHGRCAAEPVSYSILKSCLWLDICVLFSKHDLGDLWETWMQIGSDQTPAAVITTGLPTYTLTAGLLLRSVSWHLYNLQRGIMFYYHVLSSTHE